ncbi:MAG: hypothetical protein IPM59_03310 [Chloracidobacterium sp.]|nr:hypothetical protein [Chloracidobacterium sp.]
MPTLITPSAPITVRPTGPATIIRPSSVVTITPLNVIQIRPTPIAATMVRPAAVTPVTPVRAETVQPARRGAWDERGWTRRRDGDREVYEGHYQVGDHRFRGRIEVGRRRRIQAYVYNPPREIRRHRHHACFQQFGIGTGWYILHWQRSPRNVDEALLYFEQILDESINNR